MVFGVVVGGGQQRQLEVELEVDLGAELELEAELLEAQHQQVLSRYDCYSYSRRSRSTGTASQTPAVIAASSKARNE